MHPAVRLFSSGLVTAAFLAAAGIPAGPSPVDNSPVDNIDALSLEQLVQVKVETASLHEQSIESAPAAISVVTADEIRKYGYRTFGEILNHVRGFYETNDYTYHNIGIAGFSVPGDWATRLLILINGHPLADNIFGSANDFGQDFIVDVDLIERVEIVRGPSSALYGSNGIFATVNVITKKSVAGTHTTVRAETATPGDRILNLTQSLRFNKTDSLLLSATAFNNLGQHDIYIPDLAGHAIDMDGEKGYRFFANLNLANWQIIAMGVSREKTQPISWAPTIFNDRGTRATDNRAFLEAIYTREFDSRHVLRWTTSYDNYRYYGDYRYPLDGASIDGSAGIDTNKEFDAGDWIGSELTYRLPSLKGDLTAGTDLKFDLRALQNVADTLPVFNQNLLVNKLDTYAAGFLQQEWHIRRRWSFNFGARYDWSKYRSDAVSPRAAIVFQPDKQTSLKLLYGRGFRNPNMSELFFSDGKQNLGNPGLKPEQADNIELALERKYRKWTAGLSVYDMIDHKVIIPIYTPDGLQEFINGGIFRGWGAGLDVSGKPTSFLELDGSFQKQHARLDGAVPANSPGYLGKLRGAVPLRAKRLWVSAALLYQSERTTLAGAVLPPVWLTEANLVGKSFTEDIRFQAGIRNLLNVRYSDPVGLVATVDTMPQPGRTFFLTVTLR